MRLASIIIAASVAVTALSSTALAAESVATTGQSLTPVSRSSANPLYEFSARKVLGYVSEAHVAINNQQKESAIASIDQAMNELHSIQDTKDYLETMGMRSGRVLYGTGSSYYIPIADDTYAVRSYTRGPFWSADKATAIRDVELVSMDISINPTTAATRLQNAKDALNKNEYNKADNELEALLKDTIHETTSVALPLTRLQDNIYLTRILVRQQNYDGARYTLKHAKSALEEYEQTASGERKQNLVTLRAEIERLDKTIEARDPTMLEKAAAKVDEWWENIKTWTQEQTN